MVDFNCKHTTLELLIFCLVFFCLFVFFFKVIFRLLLMCTLSFNIFNLLFFSFYRFCSYFSFRLSVNLLFWNVPMLPYFNQWSHDANSCRPSVGSNPTLFAYSEEEYVKTFRFWKHACFERQAQQPACKFPPHEASSRALNSTDYARICWDPRQSISWLGSWEVSKSWIVLKWGNKP